MEKKSNGIGLFIAVLAGIFLLGMLYMNLREVPAEYKYTDIVGYFRENKVEEYSLDYGSGELIITKMEGLEVRDGKPVPLVYKVPSVALFLEDAGSSVLEYNDQNPETKIVGDHIPAKVWPVWVSFLPMILLIGGMAVLWFLMMRQSRGSGGAGVSGFGKAKARDSQEGRKVTFTDVAGIDEEKNELEEVVDFLRNPGKYNALGARIPKGILLVGPPGTGKTLLARAVAGEAGVQFFSISGSDFVELYVGVGASRVRDLFEQAKKNAPSLIFIDEIDAAGRQRGAGVGGGHDEREQTLNQLLVEMDGFSANTGVIVMGATNRADILDPALTRPGRFDRQVYIGYPDSKGREDILKIHVRNKPLAPDVDLKSVANGTIGFTGADLENTLNEAALAAARKGQKAITMVDIDDASMKVTMGPEKKSRVIMEKDKWITAYHEAGHALASYFSLSQDPVHEISIVPRGMAGGYTAYRPEEDNTHVSKTYLYERIVSALGGRVAEQLTQKDISTGASSDLKAVTKIARSMVTRYGFSDKVGKIAYEDDNSQVFLGRDYGSSAHFSESTASLIDQEVKELVDKAYNRTVEILTENMAKLKEVAEYLISNEKMSGEAFISVMKGNAFAEAEPNGLETPLFDL